VSGPRLVLITRRFWPLIGGAESAMGYLAAAFQAQGAATTILTAQLESDWPVEFHHQGVRVLRLPNPNWRWWGTWRYMRSIRHWLVQHRAEFDLVYVSMLKHDAYAALEAAERGRFPVVLRAEGSGVTGDCVWQLEATQGRRIKRRCYRADAFFASSPAIERELIAAGYDRARIQRFANPIPIPPPRTHESRRAAREALSQIQPALELSPETPLVLYAGRLHPGKGLADLINAWPAVDAARPDARLWIVGEGPIQHELHAQISDLGLSGKVILAGVFAEISDVMAAADVYAFPSYEESMSLALSEAMAAELPVVASDIEGNRLLVTSEENGLLVPPREPAAWSAALLRLLADLPLQQKLGAAARQRVASDFAVEKIAAQQLEFFDRLLQQRARGAA
jgi:glycosyltransferase involved in cell wall biosynthesis